ncbi:hypothetical protein EJ06DRAFT_89245 [Trichodelitschia bisporula]|uniref:Uncharacterized protein n=1 Tax=Trichodelitschia bisporula TaxID=703511 RepID=A0A6G1HRT5_9PEZI|nr:hypothetical protein EJ06DRAFT_89245 [Trichodelitschia bisporula]
MRYCENMPSVQLMHPQTSSSVHRIENRPCNSQARSPPTSHTGAGGSNTSAALPSFQLPSSRNIEQCANHTSRAQYHVTREASRCALSPSSCGVAPSRPPAGKPPLKIKRRPV